MTQWFRELIDLVEDLGAIPEPTQWLTDVYKLLQFQGFGCPLLTSSGTWCTCMHAGKTLLPIKQNNEIQKQFKA